MQRLRIIHLFKCWIFVRNGSEKSLGFRKIELQNTSQWRHCLDFLYKISRKSVLNICWKDWCWSWNSNTLATWCEELTHLKRPWCWERLKAGWEEDSWGWGGWMTSPTQWTWVWVSSGSWWWTGKPGVLQCMGSQRITHDWATELTSYQEAGFCKWNL